MLDAAAVREVSVEDRVAVAQEDAQAVRLALIRSPEQIGSSVQRVNSYARQWGEASSGSPAKP
jgi:hypothetical protein